MTQDTIDRFVAFLRTKFRSSHPLSPHYHDLGFDSSLIDRGEPDTEGYGSPAIDYTELLRQIDSFAAEFKKQK